MKVKPKDLRLCYFKERSTYSPKTFKPTTLSYNSYQFTCKFEKHQNISKIKTRTGVAVQQDQQHLCSNRTKVQSLAQHSGLKDSALLQLWSYGISHSWDLDQIPGPGISICCECSHKFKKILIFNKNYIAFKKIPKEIKD